MQPHQVLQAVAALLCSCPLAGLGTIRGRPNWRARVALLGTSFSFQSFSGDSVALLVWVARDAKARGMDSAVLWMLLVFFLMFWAW